MYPQGLGGEGNIDSELSQALAIKFQPSIFSEVGLMEKLMIPPGSPPDFVKEADRILGELGMQKPRTGEKEEVKLWEGIKEGLKDDLENNWNASFEMKRRRVIYAQWVSQGAVDAMAQWAEGWDLGTGWKIEGEIKGIAAGKEDPDEPEEYTGAGAEESSEGEDADVDDAATVTSSLSALSIRKNTLDFSVDTLSPQITQNAPTQIIKDARRGGTPLVERMVQYPIDPDDYRIPDFETTPFKSAFVGNNATPSNSASAPPKILRIVNDVTPTRGIPSSRMMMKENVSPTIPMSKAWNAIAANNTQKRKAEAVLLSPPPPRAVKITTPMEVDDSWTPVGKGRKAKGK